MKILKKSKIAMVILVVLAVIIVLFALVCLFLNQPSFGRLPRGERLVRIERSPNFKDGEFKNECVTPMLTNDENRIKSFINFLFKKDPGLRPDAALQVVKSDKERFGFFDLVWTFFLFHAVRRKTNTCRSGFLCRVSCFVYQ